MMFREYPPLNTPNLVAVLLRAAETVPSTIGQAQAALAARLAQAGEHPPFGPADVAPRFSEPPMTAGVCFFAASLLLCGQTSWSTFFGSQRGGGAGLFRP